jgi:hypothetical protein
MGLWRREEELFRSLPEDRQANIEVVNSAYESILSDKAYFSMPITGGRLLYNTLDHYGVKTIQELEQKHPGALREEVIIPNIEAAKSFGKRVSDHALPIVIPGIFEARKQRWSQDEYMILWLRLITSAIKELWLCEGWEYSNGGAMEFCRGIMIHYRFIEERVDRLPIFDHQGNLIDLMEGVYKLATSIKDLSQRGYDTSKLRVELGQLAGIAAYLGDHLTSRHERNFHTNGVAINTSSIIEVSEGLGVKISFDPSF